MEVCPKGDGYKPLTSQHCASDAQEKAMKNSQCAVKGKIAVEEHSSVVVRQANESHPLALPKQPNGISSVISRSVHQNSLPGSSKASVLPGGVIVLGTFSSTATIRGTKRGLPQQEYELNSCNRTAQVAQEPLSKRKCVNASVGTQISRKSSGTDSPQHEKNTGPSTLHRLLQSSSSNDARPTVIYSTPSLPAALAPIDHHQCTSVTHPRHPYSATRQLVLLNNNDSSSSQRLVVQPQQQLPLSFVVPEAIRKPVYHHSTPVTVRSEMFQRNSAASNGGRQSDSTTTTAPPLVNTSGERLVPLSARNTASQGRTQIPQRTSAASNGGRQSDSTPTPAPPLVNAAGERLLPLSTQNTGNHGRTQIPQRTSAASNGGRQSDSTPTLAPPLVNAAGERLLPLSTLNTGSHGRTQIPQPTLAATNCHRTLFTKYPVVSSTPLWWCSNTSPMATARSGRKRTRDFFLIPSVNQSTLMPKVLYPFYRCDHARLWAIHVGSAAPTEAFFKTYRM